MKIEEKGTNVVKNVFLAYDSEVLMVTVPKGNYSLNAMAFLPATLMPVSKKVSL